MGGWGVVSAFDALELLVERGGELELGPERPEVLPEREIGHHRRGRVETSLTSAHVDPMIFLSSNSKSAPGAV